MSLVYGSSRGVQKKNSSKIYFLVVTALILILIALIVIFAIKINKANTYSVEKGKVVLTIDGVEIHENLFKYFATLELDSEDNMLAILSQKTDSDMNETLKGMVKTFAIEYVYSLKEASKLGIVLTDEERQEIKDSQAEDIADCSVVTINGQEKTLVGDEFYDYYYGLTEEQYIEFLENWTIVTKYHEYLEANTVPSEEDKQYIFTNVYTGVRTTIIALSLDGLTESEITTKRNVASELLEQIQDGTKMETLVAKYCEDDTIRENNGELIVTETYATSYPDLYDWSRESKAGDIVMLETDYAILIIRCDGATKYEDYQTREDLIQKAIYYTVNKNIAELVSSNAYSVKVNDKVYSSLKLYELLDQAVADWATVWDTEDETSSDTDGMWVRSEE